MAAGLVPFPYSATADGIPCAFGLIPARGKRGFRLRQG